MRSRLIRDQFRQYRETLQADRRHLLERFEIIDVARKVVGVGSVGTFAFIVLLQGRDSGDPLFLQIKEATDSVLESHLAKSVYQHAGERVVHGQRLMQAASDIYLGWSKGPAGRYFYWRQLRDMKASAVVEIMPPPGLELYAALCGRTLARAHARSGDAVAIAEYLGATTTVRQRHRRFLAALRRSERKGLPGVCVNAVRIRTAASARGRLRACIERGVRCACATVLSRGSY